MIYQGRIGGFLWYHPVVVERTGVTTADVPASYVAEPRGRGGGDLGGQRPGLRGEPGHVQGLSLSRPRRPRRRLRTTTVHRRPDAQRAPPPPPPRGRTDGATHPPARDLHGAVLRRPVHPAQQHPGAEGQLPGHRTGQPPGRWPADRSQTRGMILSADGTVLANSVLAPPGQLLQVPAGLQPVHGHPLLPDRRVRLHHLRQLPGDRGRVQQLPHSPHPTGQDAARPAGQPHRVDNVTLTINAEPADTGGHGHRRNRRPRGAPGPPPWSSTRRPGPSRPCTPIRPSTPIPWSRQNTKVQKFAWNAYNAKPGDQNPLVPGTYAQIYPPGFELQGGDHLRRLRAPARPGQP